MPGKILQEVHVEPGQQGELQQVRVEGELHIGITEMRQMKLMNKRLGTWGDREEDDRIINTETKKLEGT